MNYEQCQIAPNKQFHTSIVLENQMYPLWRQMAGKTVFSSNGVLRILHPGFENHGSGPDFTDARIDFGANNIRCGDVEIHRNGRHWFQHKHQMDKQYSNVILHVLNESPPSGGKLKLPAIPFLVLHQNMNYHGDLCQDICCKLTENEWEVLLHNLAKERFEILKKYFLDRTGKKKLNRIFHFLDIRGNHELKQTILAAYLKIPKNLPKDSKIELLKTLIVKLPWKLGRRRPNSHPSKRVSVILNVLDLIDELGISLLSYENYKDKIRKMNQNSMFWREMQSNVLLPYLHVHLNRSQKTIFKDWCSLTCQKYGIVQRRLDIFANHQKIQNGLSQAILHLEKQYCALNACEYCPIMMHFTDEIETL